MLKEQARIGLKVIFGRGQGEKTLAKIISINDKRAKVETLEERGTKRSQAPGAKYGVPYSMMEPAPGETLRGGEVAPADVPKLEYNIFQSRVEQLILEAIGCIYGELSPENLTCDGELPRGQVQAKYATLQRQLKGLQTAIGRNVSEEEAWTWEKQKRNYLETHQGHERLMS